MGKSMDTSQDESHDVYNSKRYQSPERRSPGWPRDLYFERVERAESPDPLQD